MSVVRKQHSKYSIFISFPCNLIAITTESSINEEVWAMFIDQVQPFKPWRCTMFCLFRSTGGMEQVEHCLFLI